MAVINPPERKLAKRTSVQWSSLSQCSKSCGTGTQFRTIQVQEQYGTMAPPGLTPLLFGGGNTANPPKSDDKDAQLKKVHS